VAGAVDEEDSSSSSWCSRDTNSLQQVWIEKNRA